MLGQLRNVNVVVSQQRLVNLVGCCLVGIERCVLDLVLLHVSNQIVADLQGLFRSLCAAGRLVWSTCWARHKEIDIVIAIENLHSKLIKQLVVIWWAVQGSQYKWTIIDYYIDLRYSPVQSMILLAQHIQLIQEG